MQHSAASVPTKLFFFFYRSSRIFSYNAALVNLLLRGLFLYFRNQLMWLPNTQLLHFLVQCELYVWTFVLRMYDLNVYISIYMWMYSILSSVVCCCAGKWLCREWHIHPDRDREDKKKHFFPHLWCNIRDFGTVSFIMTQFSTTLCKKHMNAEPLIAHKNKRCHLELFFLLFSPLKLFKSCK